MSHLSFYSKQNEYGANIGSANNEEPQEQGKTFAAASTGASWLL